MNLKSLTFDREAGLGALSLMPLVPGKNTSGYLKYSVERTPAKRHGAQHIIPVCMHV